MLEYCYEKRKDNMFMMEVFEYPFWVVILGEAGLVLYFIIYCRKVLYFINPHFEYSGCLFY